MAVSDPRDEAAITPTQFYQWQKQLFEGAAAAANWKVERKHFPHATPILDLMQALIVSPRKPTK